MWSSSILSTRASRHSLGLERPQCSQHRGQTWDFSGGKVGMLVPERGLGGEVGVPQEGMSRLEVRLDGNHSRLQVQSLWTSVFSSVK